MTLRINPVSLPEKAKGQINIGRSDLSNHRKFRSPPVNEVGLSVAFSGQSILDHYDVKGMHQAFPDLPVAERVPSLGILSVADMVGGGSDMPDMAGGPPQKWWFISEDDSRVLQIQDNFLGYNWRRKDIPFGEPSNYPGFDSILREFNDRLTELEKWCQQTGRTMPNPTGCEIFYDDVIPLNIDGRFSFSMSEAMVEFNRAEKDRPCSAWMSQWIEKIDGLPDDDPSLLKVQINQLGALHPSSREPIHVLKVAWVAGAARKEWRDVVEFFKLSHQHIVNRFEALISKELQETWK